VINQEGPEVLKGFKDFILRGNVVELATAVIVGAAFTGIVTAFTSGIINPLLAAIPTGSDSCGQTSTDPDAVAAPVSVCGLGFKITDNDATFVDFGSLIAAIINFLIVAAVIYFIIIVPYNKLASLGKKPDEAEVTEIALLTEIRDILAPEDTSSAKEQAQAILPPHLSDPGGPPTGGLPEGVGDPNKTQVIETKRVTPPPASFSSEPAPYSDPSPSGPLTPPGSTQGVSYPGGSGTPTPAPGSYPPPGNYPPTGQPGSYPPGSYPPGQGYPGEEFPGDYPPDAPGRHSR
jgi:large conductance mechanosensitive channel